MADFTRTYTIDDTLNEDKIWRADIAPFFRDMNQNIRQICQYGFTEMVNNAIDHSGSKDLKINLSIDDCELRFDIVDTGVGIFVKVQKDLGLDDPKHSVLELVKGKFTSDPQKHSGEGIFFTSRIFDRFSIRSGQLLFLGGLDEDRILEEPGENEINGTTVTMMIRKDSSLLLADVFNEYADPDTRLGFHKTAVSLKLMECDGDLLMSRSQAKRLVARFDRFLEVILDFSGIDMVGQGFADELFRVFANAHPQVNLRPVNYGKNVENMIRHVGGSLNNA